MALVELKDSVFPLSVVSLSSIDLDRIEDELENLAFEERAFFEGASVVLQLPQTEVEVSDLAQMLDMLHNVGLKPVGIISDDASLTEYAQQIGLGVFAEPEVATETDEAESKPEIQVQHREVPLPTKVIRHAVRSGQQVYSEGDIIILAPVSSGADIIAEGNIHIYAPVKGRVFAGAKGDTKASVFVQNVEAEMISIAGIYALKDQLMRFNDRGLMMLSLEDKRLKVRGI